MAETINNKISSSSVDPDIQVGFKTLKALIPIYGDMIIHREFKEARQSDYASKTDRFLLTLLETSAYTVKYAPFYEPAKQFITNMF